LLLLLLSLWSPPPASTASLLAESAWMTGSFG
jgi:hypothetical protein